MGRIFRNKKKKKQNIYMHIRNRCMNIYQWRWMCARQTHIYSIERIIQVDLNHRIAICILWQAYVASVFSLSVDVLKYKFNGELRSHRSVLILNMNYSFVRVLLPSAPSIIIIIARSKWFG